VTLRGKIRHIEAVKKEADDPRREVPVYSDGHIAVRDLGFDPATGQQRLAIDENYAGVGQYQITVIFESENRVNIAFDGANVDRDKEPILKTSRSNDTVTKIEAVRKGD
jgi:hypothetical protein